MQQTEKYKFNIIETSDTFSPDALNANARTAEAQLAALAAQEAADKAALEKTAAANKTALEQALAAQKSALEKTAAADKSALLAAIGSGGKTCRIATGSYEGIGSGPVSLTFDLKPHILFIIAGKSGTIHMIMRPIASSFVDVTWTENGASWTVSGTIGASTQLNQKGTTYHYIAIGEALK